MLSERERFYVLKTKKEKDRIEKCLGWILCRMEAFHRYGVHPAEAKIGVHEQGKPFFADFPALEFNLTHGGNVIIAAFSEGRAVGVDVEALARKANLDIAKRHFTPFEADFIENTPEPQRRHVFLQYWTVKEAYLKMIGTGLTRPLDSFEIHFRDGDGIAIYDGGVLQNCETVQDESDNEHIVTVCAAGNENKFQFSPIDLQSIINFVEKFD